MGKIKQSVKQFFCKHLDKLFNQPLPSVADRKAGKLAAAHCGNCQKELGLI